MTIIASLLVVTLFAAIALVFGIGQAVILIPITSVILVGLSIVAGLIIGRLQRNKFEKLAWELSRQSSSKRSVQQ